MVAHVGQHTAHEGQRVADCAGVGVVVAAQGVVAADVFAQHVPPQVARAQRAVQGRAHDVVGTADDAKEALVAGRVDAVVADAPPRLLLGRVRGRHLDRDRGTGGAWLRHAHLKVPEQVAEGMLGDDRRRRALAQAHGVHGAVVAAGRHRQHAVADGHERLDEQVHRLLEDAKRQGNGARHVHGRHVGVTLGHQRHAVRRLINRRVVARLRRVPGRVVAPRAVKLRCGNGREEHRAVVFTLQSVARKRSGAELAGRARRQTTRSEGCAQFSAYLGWAHRNLRVRQPQLHGEAKARQVAEEIRLSLYRLFHKRSQHIMGEQHGVLGIAGQPVALLWRLLQGSLASRLDEHAVDVLHRRLHQVVQHLPPCRRRQVGGARRQPGRRAGAGAARRADVPVSAGLGA